MKRMVVRQILTAAIVLGVHQGLHAQSENAEGQAAIVSPQNETSNIEVPHDYIAQYSSAFSPTGAFTLIGRRTGDGQSLMLADIIPMPDNVIVSQRHMDLRDMRMKFWAGPYLAWGFEFVVSAASTEGHSWTRIPIAGGKPEVFVGPQPHGGYYSDMFSPFLAGLMPKETGSTFRAPAAYPRADETVSIELDTFEVLARERIELSNEIRCECWKIEKRGWDGSIEHIWVDRQAPYVFKRVRNPGSEREMTSNLLSFQVLER